MQSQGHFSLELRGFLHDFLDILGSNLHMRAVDKHRSAVDVPSPDELCDSAVDVGTAAVVIGIDDDSSPLCLHMRACGIVLYIFVMNRQSVGKRAEAKEGEIFSSICGYFALLEQQENVLQAYREAITTRPDFHPLALFNYISRGEGLITRRHVLQLLEENRILKSDDEVKILFGLYGYKERVDFVGFLNFIYPSTIEPLKYISTVGLKRYSGIPIEEGVNEEMVCLVVLLLGKEVEFIQSLEVRKQEAFPRLSKHQIKKIMRLIKKKGESKSVYEIQSENVITFAEMRLCLRKARNLQENKINAICRRLSMGKDNFINLEQMEFWLKSWNRIKNEDSERDPPKTLMDDFDTSIFR